MLTSQTPRQLFTHRVHNPIPIGIILDQSLVDRIFVVFDSDRSGTMVSAGSVWLGLRKETATVYCIIVTFFLAVK